MQCGWFSAWLVLAAMPLGAAEQGGNAAGEKTTPRPSASPQKAADRSKSPGETPPSLMEDPLAREKLNRDIWITKGIQGGFKTDDLWILDPTGGAAPAPSSGSAEKSSESAPDWRARWSGALDGIERGSAAEQAEIEQLQRIREWEKFVFGEKAEPKVERKTSDPFDASWRRPLLSKDNEPPPEAEKPGSGARFRIAPEAPATTVLPFAVKGFSDFGNPPATIPAEAIRAPVSDAARAAGLPFSGLNPRGGGLSFEPAPASSQFPGVDPSRPGAAAPPPFGLQPSGLPSFAPPRDPATGVPPVQQPVPRAHSTESFFPRRP